jgi:hypothetical protein
VNFNTPFSHPALLWRGGWIFEFFSKLKTQENSLW